MVGLGYDQGRLAFHHELGNPPVTRGHHWATARLSLEVDHEQALHGITGSRAARAHYHPSPAYRLAHLVTRRGQVHLDLAGDGTSHVLERTEAEHLEARVGKLRRDERPGCREHVQPLLLDEAAHEEDYRIPAGQWRRLEVSGVHPGRDHLDTAALEAHLERTCREVPRWHDHSVHQWDRPLVRARVFLEVARQVVPVERHHQRHPGAAHEAQH